MSATERETLDDFDTRKLQERVDETSLRIEKTPFRGSLRYATEQPQSTSSNSTAPPQSLAAPYPKATLFSEAGRRMEAEGHVLEAYRSLGISQL